MPLGHFLHSLIPQIADIPMTTVPFSGRLDLSLATLLVIARHTALANRSVTLDDITADVVELIDLLDVDAATLGDLDGLGTAVDAALTELINAGWVRRRNYRGVIRHVAPPLGEDALDWVRDRLANDPVRRHALDELDAEVTELVLDRYGESLRESAAGVDAPA